MHPPQNDRYYRIYDRGIQYPQKFTNYGYVYVEVQKGIYSLPHSGIITHQLLEERLNKHGTTKVNKTLFSGRMPFDQSLFLFGS